MHVSCYNYSFTCKCIPGLQIRISWVLNDGYFNKVFYASVFVADIGSKDLQVICHRGWINHGKVKVALHLCSFEFVAALMCELCQAKKELIFLLRFCKKLHLYAANCTVHLLVFCFIFLVEVIGWQLLYQKHGHWSWLCIVAEKPSNCPASEDDEILDNWPTSRLSTALWHCVQKFHIIKCCMWHSLCFPVLRQ